VSTSHGARGIEPIRQPLLKWPGGKRELLPHILPLVAGPAKRYYEPFVGGGAVFFALAPTLAILSDYDSDLINCYRQVRNNPRGVVARLRAMRNSATDYYRIRRSVPRSDAGAAARTIYLSTLSFNGIHRKNQRGEFNVPYGYKHHLVPCDTHRITTASAALQVARLYCGDFEAAVDDAGRGDVVYLDPPYTVAHSNNGFIKYNAKIFSWADQTRLATLVDRLASRGCRVVVSNADHPSILQLYRGFNVKRIERPSRIAASKAFRRRITECIFYS